MKTTVIEIENKVEQLLNVLDKDIRYLNKTLSNLNELRSMVIKRDDASLHKLLESTRSDSKSYKDNELKRQRLREELAFALDCSLKQVTLSRLENELSEEKRAQVTRRKSELNTLAEKFRKEHLNTAMLLSDCAKFNSLLLKSVLGSVQTGTITYDPRGSAERQTNSVFVNLQS